MPAVVLKHVLAHEHRDLQAAREFISPCVPVGVGIEEAGDVESFPGGAETVAFHHQVGEPFEGDGRPDRLSVEVHGDRTRLHLRSQLFEAVGGFAYPRIDVAFAVGQVEALLDHADPQAGHASSQGVGVAVDSGGVLPRIEAVFAGDHFEQQGVIGHVVGHRAGVIDGRLDGHDARVRHQAMGGLHAITAAKGRRNTDRAALVAANGHVDLFRAHQRSRAAGRPPGGVAHLEGVVHWASGAGMRATRKAEMLTVRFAADRPSCGEDARDNGGIDIRSVAFEGRGAVHHGHAGQANVVFDGDILPFEGATGAATHFAFVVPGVERIFFSLRSVAGRAWVAYGGQVVGHGIDAIVGLEGVFHQGEVGFHFAAVHVHAELVDDALQLFDGWAF